MKVLLEGRKEGKELETVAVCKLVPVPVPVGGLMCCAVLCCAAHRDPSRLLGV
jgi:hypothetical protein